MSGDAFNRGLAELAALYAAGALSGEERAAVEARLASGDEALSAAVSAFSDVIEALAAAAPAIDPPPEILQELLKRVAAPPEIAIQSETPHLGGPPATVDQTGELVVLLDSAARWKPLAEGVETRILFLDRAEQRVTVEVRLAPGVVYPPHYHGGAEECLVLEGDLRVGDYVLGRGDYQRAPAGSWHGPQSTVAGCRCIVIASLLNLHTA